jgi:hypothetical protein
VKLQEATSIGKWISQNENVLTDVTMMEGITSSILGLDPERVSDAFNQLEALSVRKDRQAALKKEMIADYKRGIIAMRQGYTEEASKYFSRVKAYGVRGDFTTNQMADIYMQAASNEPLDESVLRSYEKYITEGK